MANVQQTVGSIEKLRSEKSLFLTIIFSILLFNLEAFFFNGNQIFYLIYAFFDTGITTSGLQASVSVGAGTLSIISLLGTVFVFWLTFNSTGRYKVIYFLLFGSAALIQFGYWNAVNRFFNAQDFYTNVSVSGELWLDSIGLFFDPSAFVIIGLYGFFLFFIRPKTAYSHKAFGLITAIVFGTGLAGGLINHPNFATFSTHAFYRSMAQVALAQSGDAQLERETLPADFEPPAPTRNVVLIIDESITAGHLSLYGYGRETTPMLEDLAKSGQMAVWQDAISSAPCSVVSNAVLTTGISQFPDSEKQVRKNPTIYHYAKTMGYTTHYLDGSSGALWNGLQSDDLLTIDNYVNQTDLNFPEKHEIDFLLAQQMREILTGELGQFIVINKVGVHFPYERTYPADRSTWTDSPPLTDNPDLIERINHYDNGLRYNSDLFFQTLMPDGSVPADSVFVYTSDHGQDLGEISGRWSHCGTSVYEMAVPLMLIGPLPQPVDTGVPAHHFNIFPTLLDLLGVPDGLRAGDYAPSLFALSADDDFQRVYMPGNGDIFASPPIFYDE